MADSGYLCFDSPGGVQEKFIALTATPGRDFVSEAEALLARYRHISRGFMPVMERFHLSDPANQAEALRKITGGDPVLVGQPPANGARIAIEAWLLDTGSGSRKTGGSRLTEVLLKNYRLLNLRTPELHGSSSFAQMLAEFKSVTKELESRGGNLADNLLRTWIYCRDIDNNYGGLVIARREFFREHGLTSASHFIASTGIEGTAEQPSRLIRMDSLAIFGHSREQIEFMNAPEYLCPTHHYGVTFERGVRVIYGDRSHYFISGTASIDREGKIVHPGDVVGQTKRMLENVSALLESSRAGLSDLKMAVVYLRDPADRAIVENQLEAALPQETPRLLLRGAVCRPGWLVEMEGIAVNGNGDRNFRNFS